MPSPSLIININMYITVSQALPKKILLTLQPSQKDIRRLVWLTLAKAGCSFFLFSLFILAAAVVSAIIET